MSVRDRVARHRVAMRERGFRQIQMWVPDARTDEFKREAQRQTRAVRLAGVNRGELWTVSGGTYAQKPLPGLIVQDDLFADSESVTLLPLTSHLVDAPLLRLTLDPGKLNGLDRVSQIMSISSQPCAGPISDTG